MQLSQWLLIGIIVLPLILVFSNRLRMDLAALLMAVLLAIGQLCGLGMVGAENTPGDAIKAFSGASQSVIFVLISLFILTRGLEKSGLVRWIAWQVIRLGGNKTSRIILLLAGITAFLSLFMNNLAAGALVLPGALETARRTGIKPSKLLIPVAYGSLLGGSATYFTTANMLMSDLLQIATPPQPALTMLSFTPTGGVIVIAGLFFLWLLGDRLLPNHEGGNSNHAQPTGNDLEEFYQLGERLWRARVKSESPLAGVRIGDTRIGAELGITVAAVCPENSQPVIPSPTQKFSPGVPVILVGNKEKIDRLAETGMEITPLDAPAKLTAMGLNLVELTLTPRSTWQGQTLKTTSLRKQWGITALAIRRGSRSYRTGIGEIPIQMGDSILALGSPEQINAFRNNPDIFLVDPDPGDQPVNRVDAGLSGGITLLAIIAAIAGVPVAVSMVTGAVAILLTRKVSMEEAYRSIEWPAVFLITGMYAVSLAMVQTGLANQIGKGMINLVSPLGGLGLAGGAYLLTGGLTQLIGGQVAALVTGPVLINAAIQMGINPQAVAVAAAIGCSASFLTPMAHPVNILMINPGNYTFRDFTRIGLLLTLICFAALLVGLVIFWGL